MRGEDILARGEEEKRREDNGLRIEGGRERERERERGEKERWRFGRMREEVADEEKRRQMCPSILILGILIFQLRAFLSMVLLMTF